LISHNELKTLRGCPKMVEGIFDGCHNDLRSLDYAPSKVGSDTWFSYNKLSFTEIEKYRELRGANTYLGPKNMYFSHQFL